MTDTLHDTNDRTRTTTSRPRGAPGPRSWLCAGTAVAAIAWGANEFAPLLLVYRSRLGLSAATVEATFGLYALGLVPAVLVCGRLSDRYGRRRVMLPALLVSALADALLIAGGSRVGLLFAGRLAAGLASGAAFGAGAAWIKELSTAGASRPDESGPRRVTVSMTAGFAGGPLVAGLLAQFAPAPTVVPYLPQLALLALGAVLASRTPETGTRAGTTDRERGRERGRNPGRRLPAPHAARFRTVILPLAPWVFGSAAIALAYLPGLIQARLGDAALTFTAVVTMLTALAGIAVQPLARRLAAPDTRRLVGASLGIVVAGLLLSAVAAATGSAAAVVVAALVLGAGYGACQVCGLLEIQRLARPDALAGLTAVYQAVSYLGFALPFALSALAGLAPASMLLLALATLAALTLAWTVRHAAPGDGARRGARSAGRVPRSR